MEGWLRDLYGSSLYTRPDIGARSAELYIPHRNLTVTGVGARLARDTFMLSATKETSRSAGERLIVPHDSSEDPFASPRIGDVARKGRSYTSVCVSNMQNVCISDMALQTR